MTEHTYALGDRVAYVEPGAEPNGHVYIGTITSFTETGEYIVDWDDPIDDDPWQSSDLHPIGPRK